MKEAFVTGSTGFLGLNLIERLQRNNWEITALHLPGEDLKYLSRYNVKAVPGNILDIQSLQNAIPKNVDAIFHMAGDKSMRKIQIINLISGLILLLAVSIGWKSTG